jgi:hypothetical protein
MGGMGSKIYAGSCVDNFPPVPSLRVHVLVCSGSPSCCHPADICTGPGHLRDECARQLCK